MSTHDYDFIRSASKLLGYEQEERRKEWYEELEQEVCSICPTLTYQQRLIGCVIMMIVGFILSMGSLSRLVQLLAGNPAPFAIMYTLGNLVSISSTCFLFGPWAQAKKMFAMTRIVTTSIYFFFMAVCLFLAFYPGTIPVRVLWLVIAVLCQFMALIWYTLSFIPYARDIALACCTSCCKQNFGCQCGGSGSTSSDDPEW